MAKKQLDVPGTERKEIREVTDAADSYCEQMTKRVKQSAKEKDAKTALIASMRKHKIDVYRLDDGRTVTLASKDNVKVTSVEQKFDEETGEAA